MDIVDTTKPNVISVILVDSLGRQNYEDKVKNFNVSTFVFFSRAILADFVRFSNEAPLPITHSPRLMDLQTFINTVSRITKLLLKIAIYKADVTVFLVLYVDMSLVSPVAFCLFIPLIDFMYGRDVT